MKMIISRLRCFLCKQIWIIFELLRLLCCQLLCKNSLLFTSLFLHLLLELPLNGFLLNFHRDNLVKLFLG